nr:ATP synthase subunit 4 [Haplopteris ensiformis]UQV94691.1 ATP synthase subunit 4 [Haplopteris ensiformis]UQV94707.1 ATP synthase subunit 4 [Haplopteris ensiformis]UQV94726.1 ATP synthase subunit 4 [Haplopteris ensiformis]
MHELLIFALLTLGVLSSKKILIYSEEILIVACLVGFVFFSKRNLSDISKAIFRAKSEALQTYLKDFLSYQGTLWSQSEEQHDLLLRCLCPDAQMIAESFFDGTIERCTLLYKQTVQALLCQEMGLDIKALLAIREHPLIQALLAIREYPLIREQDEIASCFRFLVSDELGGFSSETTHKSTLLQSSMGFLEGGDPNYP